MRIRMNLRKFLLGASVVLCVVSLFVAGCSDENSSEGDTDGQLVGDASGDADDSGGDVDGDTVAQVCEPGKLIECSEQNTPSIVQCNARGTGTEPASCPDSHVCRNSECVEVDCIPGAGRCQDGAVQECNVAGTEWVTKKTCSGDAQCEKGACLNRCELAAERDSYIGCEYWAVELENHLLYEERETGDPIPEDQMPPFGVVLANTSDSYEATVSVYNAEGSPAQAIPTRKVGAEIAQGITPRRVDTELVDQQGQQLLGPEQFDGQNLTGVPISEGSMLTLLLPNKRIPDSETSLKKTAYRIESSQPIVAYQFNPYCCNYNYTNDASLLLPTSALSRNYMYMSYPVWNHPQRPPEEDTPESPGIAVVATEPDTSVEIDLREPHSEGASFSDILYPISSDRISGPDEQGEMSVTMQPHEVLNVSGKGIGEDLTGARIEANKPISTFGTHSCAFVPFSRAACDHLETQLLPMETWGRNFAPTPLKKRGPADATTREGTYWKILAQENGTEIETGLNLDPGPEGVLPAAGEGVPACAEFSEDPSGGNFRLDAGESCEFGTQTTYELESNNPILVGAFLSGQESVGQDVERAGDPAFFQVPPEQQYRSEYSFLTPVTYAENWVTVTASLGKKTVVLDGEEIELTNLEHYKAFPDRGVMRAHIKVEEGPHRISSDTGDFSIVTYGYHDYVSYAYTGGLDLAKRNTID